MGAPVAVDEAVVIVNVLVFIAEVTVGVIGSYVLDYVLARVRRPRQRSVRR